MPPQGPEGEQNNPNQGPSGLRSALNKLRLPIRMGKGAKLLAGAAKAKVFVWIAVAVLVLMAIGLLFLMAVGMTAGMPTQTGCGGGGSAATDLLAPGGGIVVGASEYGGPGDPGTPGDKGAFGSLEGHMAYAELGLSGVRDNNWRDANKIGIALGLGKALPPNTKLQITANGHSVIAEKLDDGAGGGPVGDPPRERVIDLWYQTAQALGLDTADSGEWSGLVTIKLAAGQSVTQLAGEAPTASASSQTAGLGTGTAVAYAQSQTSLVGFAVVSSSGQIVSSYNATATDYGRSITKTMLLVAYLRQAGDGELSAQARTNLQAMIERSANGNEGPGADWVYHQLHDPNAQIEQVAHDAGMSNFRLDTSDPVYVLGRSHVSAQDMALLFSKIRQLIPNSQRGYAMTLLSNIAPGDPGHEGIYNAGVASGPIYSKSGWEQETNRKYTFNQAALVTIAGQQYAIAVITANNPSFSVGESIVQNIATDLFAPLTQPAAIGAADTGLGCEQEPQETGELGARIVRVAQSQLGVYDGGSYCSPYSQGRCEFWCSDFLTWAWEQAGVNIPRLPGSEDVYRWGETHTSVLPPTATPAPGDAVEFGTGPQSTETSTHVAIVEQVFPNGEIMTINGDYNHHVEPAGPFQPSQAATDSGSGHPIYGYVVP